MGLLQISQIRRAHGSKHPSLKDMNVAQVAAVNTS